jgi:2-polyprenyl-3-methyl-5-hydroxy-6-metoxy-1,4-benzoquinol methylase
LSDRCRICGNGDGNVKHQVREMMFGQREEFTYLECAACGCLQIDRAPDDLSRYYPDNYYAFDNTRRRPGAWDLFVKRRHSQFEAGRWNLVGWAVDKRFPHRTIPWLRVAAPNVDDPILDVGCGGGGALNDLAERGYRDLTGIDPYIDSDVTGDNGVRILKRDLADVDRRYRLIMCHHAFEHMSDPEASLGHMARLLEPACMAVIRIPVSQCNAWKQYGVNWIQIDAPRHQFLHNERTMELLASRVGMVVEKVVYDSNAFQFAGSEGYVRDIPFVEQPAAKLFSKEEIKAFDKRADALNASKQGDQAAFYLRKLPTPAR